MFFELWITFLVMELPGQLYFKQNQSILQVKLYKNAIDVIHARNNSNNVGYQIILSSSFIDRPH